MIVERRDVVGGACNTEEFAPGYRASTGAYVLSMWREAVWRDMRLARRGVTVDPVMTNMPLVITEEQLAEGFGVIDEALTIADDVYEG